MVRKKIYELQNLGRLSDDVIDKYIIILEEIESPVNFEEAKILVGLFPDDTVDGCGVDWSLLHLFETVGETIGNYSEDYEDLIELCPGDEWKSILKARLRNYKEEYGIN